MRPTAVVFLISLYFMFQMTYVLEGNFTTPTVDHYSNTAYHY